MVEVYKSQYPWGPTDMYSSDDCKYVIVKENDKYYLYSYTQILKRAPDDVKAEYDNMDDE